jgi:hypothetical protein
VLNKITTLFVVVVFLMFLCTPSSDLLAPHSMEFFFKTGPLILINSKKFNANTAPLPKDMFFKLCMQFFFRLKIKVFTVFIDV